MKRPNPRTSNTTDKSSANAPETPIYSEGFTSRSRHAPVSRGSPDEFQSSVIQNYSFMAHNWVQDGGFIDHKPSGGLLRPGLKSLPGPQVQLGQMELGTPSELLLGELGDSATEISKVPLGAQCLVFHPISYLLNRLTTYCMLVRSHYTLD